MERLPPLKSLTFFLSAANHLSFKKASEELFVTQAAVSQQIKLLESFFGKPLFRRVGVKTELTAYGESLYPYVELAIEQIRLGTNAVNSVDAKSSIVVTGTHSFTSLFLGPRIDSYIGQSGATGVQLAPSNHILSFSNDGIDLAIRRGKGNYTGLESRLLYKDKVVLIVSPMLLRSRFDNIDLINKEDVLKLPLLEDTSGDITEAIEYVYQQAGIDRPIGILQTTDAVPIIQSAIAGKGIAFASHFLVSDMIKEGILLNPCNIEFHSDVNIYMVAPEQYFERTIINQFCKWLVDEVRQMG